MSPARLGGSDDQGLGIDAELRKSLGRSLDFSAAAQLAELRHVLAPAGRAHVRLLRIGSIAELTMVSQLMQILRHIGSSSESTRRTRGLESCQVMR